jgi:hypothetical protein
MLMTHVDLIEKLLQYVFPHYLPSICARSEKCPYVATVRALLTTLCTDTTRPKEGSRLNKTMRHPERSQIYVDLTSGRFRGPLNS